MSQPVVTYEPFKAGLPPMRDYLRSLWRRRAFISEFARSDLREQNFGSIFGQLWLVLNPLLLEGQIHGGVAQGTAQALLEEVRYDADGNPITSNLADYAFISAAELPSFEVVHMETPTFLNPLGAKGIGESGTIGSTPAVQSAVVDAVSHLGVRHIDMPTTAERVWLAIAAAK